MLVGAVLISLAITSSELMLHIKSVNSLSTHFSLNSDGSCHYHDCHDSESLPVTDIWLWLIKNPHCNKVLVIREKNLELPETDLSPTSASTIAIDHIPTKENSNTWAPVFGAVDSAIGTKFTREDSEGNRWEITAESKDKKDSDILQFCQVFRLRLRHPESPQADCKSASEIGDRLLTIFSLEATWDGDSLPLIAEFKKQVLFSMQIRGCTYFTLANLRWNAPSIIPGAYMMTDTFILEE